MEPLDPATEDMLVPLSALQHYLFCPRQCGLIHVECVWAENDATADGRLMHERVDEGQSDRRGGRYVVTAPAGVEVAGAAFLGVVRGAALINVPLDVLRKAHESFFQDWMEG